MKLLKLSLVLSFTVFFTQTYAQDNESWSLEKCILHSQKASIAINQSELGVSQADITLDQAQQARYPSLNGNTNVQWNFGRTVDPTTNEFNTETFFSNNFGLNTNVTLFNGFRIKNNVKQAELDLDAAKADTEQMRRTVALQVATNFLNVLFAQENITLAEKQLLLSQQQLDQVNKLIEAGARPESERLNLEAQIAQSEQIQITSKNTLDIAILQLKQVLRLDPSYPFSIEAPEDIEITTDPDMVNFEEAFILAQENRPDLYANQLRIQSAIMGEKIAKGGLYPSVSVGGSLGSAYSNRGKSLVGFEDVRVESEFDVSFEIPGLPPLVEQPVTLGSVQEFPILEDQKYTDQLDQNLSYGFGLGVNIPIYNRGNTKGSIQIAKLNAINAQLSYDQNVETLKITVQQALADARAAKKKLEASEKSLQAQQLAFENTTKRLDLGAANTFEWESQKTQMENAEVQRLMDKYDYLFKIKILEFYLGKPLKL
ncbi:MAG: TolC family protein [Saprospiraceae bacterium]|nr:TolC family protein [Bacteroidia bacterium]NNE13859.1 TolC family protein [Saprospiraceae bacterium]NNL91569.1 TolC family protein [Saprospiraceae bacterium]